MKQPQLNIGMLGSVSDGKLLPFLNYLELKPRNIVQN